MPARELRKVLRHGSSYVVTIPKAYADYHGLKPGSIITVLYDSLVIMAPKDVEDILRYEAELIDQLLGRLRRPQLRCKTE